MAYGDPQPTAPIVAGVPAPGTLPTYIPYAALTSEQSFTTSELAGRIGQFNGSLVTTNGAATVGDGNGAQFVWVLGDSTPANGTTVLGASAYGRWRLAVAGGGGGGLSGTSFIFSNQASGALADGGTVAAEAIYFDGNAGARAYSGLLPPTSGKLLKVLHNRGSFAITLQHNTGTANQRFINPAGTDYTLSAGKSITLSYDTTAATWRLVAQDAAFAALAAQADRATAIGGITLAAAAATSGLADNSIVHTVGYRNADPPSAGAYRFALGDSATADGGSVVSATGGRLHRLSVSQANVLLWGAYNDGTHTTETTAAIRAALAYAVSRRVPLYFPGGTYNVADATHAALITATSSLEIYGDGPAMTTIITDDMAMDCITFDLTATTGITLRVEGLEIGNFRHQINLEDTRDFATRFGAPKIINRESSLSHLRLSGWWTTGLRIVPTCIGMHFKDLNVMGGWLQTGSCGVKAVGSGIIQDTHWTSCRFAASGPGGAGFWVEDPSTGDSGAGNNQIYMSQPIFEGNSAYGMYAKGAKVYMHHAYFEQNGSRDVYATTNFDGSTVIPTEIELNRPDFNIRAASQVSGANTIRCEVGNDFVKYWIRKAANVTAYADAIQCNAFAGVDVDLRDTPQMAKLSTSSIQMRREQPGNVQRGIVAYGVGGAAVGVSARAPLYGGGGVFTVSATNASGTANTTSQYLLRQGYGSTNGDITLIHGLDIVTWSFTSSGDIVATPAAAWPNGGCSYDGSRG